MLLSLRTAAALATALVLLAACEAETAAGPDADAVAPADTTSAADTAAADLSGDPGASGPDADALPAGSFTLGTQEQGLNTPDAFQELAEGGDLEVVFGPQGLWMVVLALRTRDLLEPPLWLEAEILVAGVSQGKLALKDQKLVPGGDGFDYYYNFFLVVSDPTVAGQVGTLEILARDVDDLEHTVTRAVQLTGGP